MADEFVYYIATAPSGVQWLSKAPKLTAAQLKLMGSLGVEVQPATVPSTIEFMRKVMQSELAQQAQVMTQAQGAQSAAVSDKPIGNMSVSELPREQPIGHPRDVMQMTQVMTQAQQAQDGKPIGYQ